MPSAASQEVASRVSVLAQPDVHADPAEDAEVLQASIRTGSVAQIVVAVIAVIGLTYLLKLVLVTTLASLLLAFVLEPLVSGLARIHIPRAFGALLAAVLMVGLAAGLTFFFYGRAVDFATQLLKYSGKIRSTLAVLREQTSQIEESTRAVIASPRVGKTPLAVEVQEAPGLSRVISAGGGTLGEVFLAITFVPFLVYFMLTWKDHAHSATLRLFPKEHRLVAHRTVGRISAMIRSFIAGNALIGLINALVSTIVFWQLGIPYFYFLGVVSGFASLVPYLGVFLALLPPLAGGVGIVNKSGVLVIVLTVVGLHGVDLWGGDDRECFYQGRVGFTLRTITSPDADIAADQIKTATGSYSATATISTGKPWVMQMATFRAVP